MTGFLLDTNCISELVSLRPNSGVVEWFSKVDEDALYLSVLTLGEIRKGITGLSAGKRRTELEAWIESGLKPRFAGRILLIDDVVAETWGVLSAKSKLRGTTLNTVDGLIAATALNYELTVVTRNVDDFSNTKVALLNPWK